MSTSNISVVELEAQLRQAEGRRAEVERQYAEALSNLRSSIATDPLEARQSKVRELEKKVALETVRVEELQLELASQRRTTSSSALSSAAGVVGVSTLSSITSSVPSSSSSAAAAITSSTSSWTGGNHQSHHLHQQQQQHHHHQPISSTTNVTSANVQTTPQQGTEIERIMAKIEQDNRILAELEHSRSTTLSAPECQWGLSSSATGSTNNNQLDPSVYGGTTAVSAPVSPLPSQNPNNLSGSVHTNYQYAPNNLGTASTSNTNMSGLYSQQQFSSSAPGCTGGSGVSGAYGAYTSSLPPGVSSAASAGIYTNHHHATNVSGITSGLSGGITSSVAASSYVNPLLTNQQPYSNLIAATSALTNQQSTVFTNNTGGISGLAGTALGGVGSSYTSAGLANHSTFSNPLTSTLGGYSTLGNTTSLFNNNASTFSNNPLISSTNQWSSPAMTVKLKPLEECELGRRIPTPVTPHAPNIWDRPLSRPTITGGGLSDSGGGGDWGMGITDGQVDMLDIPGKGRCSVYIARFSYEPDLEASEDELPVSAGDYLLVWSEPGAAYLDAELLDGRRGLVPAHFAQRLVGDDLLDFHQAVLSSLRDEESAEMLAADVQRLCELTDVNEEPEDETIDTQVGAPRQLTLERQLNKSVLISWTAPEPGQPGSQVESYHVYVDGVLKTTVKASERTRALVEGVDSNRPHRISVRSVTANRRTSRDAACTMVIGRDTQQLGPTSVRASHVTSSSAIISWLPANSNHQHVVCVNNVEVRTVKPGVYRHTITGLTPNTQYRVTVRAKHIRAQPAVPGEEPPCPASAHTDFRTLPKGLPDPPADIMVEAGPQDGTLLVTWHPVQAPHHPGSIVTGYAVYADGKKVTDVDSPTGDHALIDISKLLGLNPRHVTVRTKARDSQSADSVPTAIPPQVLRGGLRQQRQPHSGVPPHMRPQQRGQPGGPQQQVIIEHEDNLSDKEIFPSGQMHHRTQGPGIPQIEITKDSAPEGQLTEEDYMHGRGARGMAHHQGQQPQHAGNMHQYQQQQQQPGVQQGRNMQQQQRGTGQTMHGAQGQAQAQYYQQQQQPTQQQNLQQNQRGTGAQNRRGGPQQQGTSNQQGQAPSAPKKARWFVAMYDYDPTTMSPNPDACEEELPFSEGDSIKVWGDKDPDGFYWGECRGRRGYVPHNMVMEVDGPPRTNDRDRWGDIYANMPVKRMVALYDYDPQELSPNVDSEVELSFTTGSIIHVYGEMDDDGFYMGELDGVRGLVPSNFLTEASDQFQGPGSVGPGMMQQQTSGGAGGSMGPRSQRNMMGAGGGGGGGAVSGGSGGSGGGSGVGGRGHGPGARGPPPPPRGVGDGPVGMSPSSAAGGMPPGATPGSRSGAPRGTKTDACPVVPCSQLDTTTNTVTTVSPPNTLLSSSTEQQQQAAMRNQQRGGVQRGGTIGGSQPQQTQQQQQQQQYQQSPQQQQQSNTFQNQNNQLNNQNQYQQNQQYMGQQQMGNDPMMNRSQQPMHKGTPSVLPNLSFGGPQQQGGQPGQQGQQPQNATNAPNALMQKFTEMAAPGGDILSKGKELIFMKFGLGGK